MVENFATPGNSIDLQVLLNDFDDDGDLFTTVPGNIGHTIAGNCGGHNNAHWRFHHLHAERPTDVPDGGFLTDSFSYFINDGTVDSAEVVVTVTIHSDTIADVVSTPNTQSARATQPQQNQGVQVVDLLQTAAERMERRQNLFAVNVTLDSGDDGGVTFDPINNQLIVDTSYYEFLHSSDAELIRYTWDISDTVGNTINQAITIRVAGVQ